MEIPKSVTVRRTAEEMFAHLERFARSGLSRKAYCEAHGLSFHVLGYWVKRLQEKEDCGGFAELHLRMDRCSVEGGLIELEYPNGVRVRIGSGMSAAYVRSLAGVGV
jgi:hypothetical protein